MIYDEPKFLPGGDRYVLIEFGNEMNLELNFIAQGLAARIVADKTKGIVETAPASPRCWSITSRARFPTTT